MVDMFRNRCQNLQNAVEGDDNARHRADAKKYQEMLRQLEEEHSATIISLTQAKDEVDVLTRRLAEYDDAIVDLDRVIHYRHRIEKLESKLSKSQELVTLYQVCIKF